MKLSKIERVILLWIGVSLLTPLMVLNIIDWISYSTGLVVLSTFIGTPIIINKYKNKKENDVEKLFKILKAKTKQEKIIELPSDASGKIIANNQEKIIEKIKTLIGTSNLKEVKIEVSMQSDTNVSTSPQKIIIKLTKNKISKEIKGFSVKK